MTDSACDRCRQKEATHYSAWDMALCPACAEQYQRIEEAREQLKDMLRPIIAFWAAHWLHHSLTEADLSSCLQNITESSELGI